MNKNKKSLEIHFQTLFYAKTGMNLRTISDLANNKMERIPKKAITKIATALDIHAIREIIDFKNESK